jgi:transglutaminase-like putative cysteine protease
MIAGLSSWRALLWVAIAVAAAAAVLPAARVVSDWRRGFALGTVAMGALLAGYMVSGPELEFLRPRHWDELVSGLAGGFQTLGTVRLPYASADPWPRIVLELLGTELLIFAGLLTFWPRIAPEFDERAPLAVPDRGYPFVALGVLIIVVASPVVSLGGPESLLLGLLLAALSVCFLWLERLPLRPGLGVAALLAIVLAGALPLAAIADRGEPWFDYRAFAESLGPDDPVRFSWKQAYGPIDWPRNGNEVMRVSSTEPLYWKARNLDVFDGTTWTVREEAAENPRGEAPFEADLPDDWTNRPGWTNVIEFSIRRVRSTEVFGAGTSIEVRDSSRSVQEGISPGTWDAPSALRRGDSYGVQVHVPKPTTTQLETATSGERERQDGERKLVIPFKPGVKAPVSVIGDRPDRPTEAEVNFAPFDGQGFAVASYPKFNRAESDLEKVMGRSAYERTWELSQRLREDADSAMDYIRAVDEYLHRPEFRYVERPVQPGPGVPPLDFFINDSHEGYCQHFAGAMALLLRMGGLSARVATGFTPGGYSQRHEAWIVRDTDAHAWVEVWFDQWGWVTLDPTPDATPARSQVAALAAPPSSAPLVPDRGPGADPDDGGSSGPQSVRPELQVGSSDPSATSAGSERSLGWLRWFGLTVLVGGALLALLLFLRRPRGKTPMDRAIAEVEAAMRRVGRPVTTGTTLGQLESRLGSHSPEVKAYFQALAAGRYGLVWAPPTREGRRALRRALAQGLGLIGPLRAWWAMPPRFERRRRDRSSRVFEVETSVRG